MVEIFITSFNNYKTFIEYNMSNFYWGNPIIWLLISATICFCLELGLIKRIKYSAFSRKGFWGDLIYIVLNDFIFPMILLYPMSMVAGYLFEGFVSIFKIEIPLSIEWTEISIVAAFLVFFIIQDFLEYIAHYLLHRIPFFWAFHQIHHSPTEIGFSTARRFHFGEMLAFKPLLYIPFGILGMGTYTYFLIHGILNNFSSFFTHSNIRVKLGVWKYILNNPEHHYWHHSYNIPNKIGVNYASILNIWDYMFRTVYLPKKKKHKLGLEYSNKIPKDIFGQLLFPIKWMLNRTNYKR